MKILVTGGAGFIGSNFASTLMQRKDDVIIFDNMSRVGARDNIEWLRDQGELEVVVGDVRRIEDLEAVFNNHTDIGAVVHLAGQVAVTTSVKDPRHDFETNALGTFNVCDVVRRLAPEATLIYSSTNKVYGGMEDLAIEDVGNRYQYRDLSEGVSETRCLDFHSPYGVSKGCGDQYVRDFSRIYGTRSVSLRQSCIYGTRQFGVEDQGWVAWFIIASVLGKPITIFGDGKQIRDILFIDDLTSCFLEVMEKIDSASGQIYNVGGGPSNTLSLLELIDMLQEILGREIEYSFDDWRPGDQKVYVSNISKARDELGWEPKISPREGVERLTKWVVDNKEILKNHFI